jgi:hypothetical protein
MGKLAEDPIYRLHQLYAEINIIIQKIRHDQIYDILNHYSYYENQLDVSYLDNSISNSIYIIPYIQHCRYN